MSLTYSLQAAISESLDNAEKKKAPDEQKGYLTIQVKPGYSPDAIRGGLYRVLHNAEIVYGKAMFVTAEFDNEKAANIASGHIRNAQNAINKKMLSEPVKEGWLETYLDQVDAGIKYVDVLASSHGFDHHIKNLQNKDISLDDPGYLQARETFIKRCVDYRLEDAKAGITHFMSTNFPGIDNPELLVSVMVNIIQEEMRGNPAFDIFDDDLYRIIDAIEDRSDVMLPIEVTDHQWNVRARNKAVKDSANKICDFICGQGFDPEAFIPKGELDESDLISDPDDEYRSFIELRLNRVIMEESAQKSLGQVAWLVGDALTNYVAKALSHQQMSIFKHELLDFSNVMDKADVAKGVKAAYEKAVTEAALVQPTAPVQKVDSPSP